MFPDESTPEEIIYGLAEGDIIIMNVLINLKISEVKKLMITRSKKDFIDWYNEPEKPEDKKDNIAG